MDQKIKAKICLDFFFCFTFAIIPFCRVFGYLKFIRIGLFGFEVEENEEFAFDVGRDGEDCVDIIFLEGCSEIEAWEKAGVAFICIGVAAVIGSVLAILNILNLYKKWNVKVLGYWQYHYVYPFLYSIAVCIYWYISKIFNTYTPNILTEEYEVTYGLGLYLMVLCEIFAMVSTGFFTFCDLEDKPIQVPLLNSQ